LSIADSCRSITLYYRRNIGTLLS